MASSGQQSQGLQQHTGQKQQRREILGKENTIIFRHPGYPDELDQNILFILYAFDDNNGSPGLHYQTALKACAIIADNASDGFFTTRQGDQEVSHEASQMLSPDHEYYFHVPGIHPEPYAICPSFADWVFPHGAIPSEFMSAALTPFMRAPRAASSFSLAVTQRDGSCRLSFYRDCIESAHLVPKEEARWFDINSMSMYNRNKLLSRDYFLDDAGNGIALRKDIHTSFDYKDFAIVPKNGKWVVHFFGLTNDYGPEHHNQPIELLREVSPAFLLARLAWTIFPLLAGFLRRRVSRVLRYRVQVNGNESTETQRLSAEQIDQLITRRGRSSNPRKTPSPSKRRLPSDPEDVQEQDSWTPRAASSEASRCHKVARTDSGYADGEDDDSDNDTVYHPSETYQALPYDQRSHSSASSKTIFLPSVNTFDLIYPRTLPFHSRNPIAKQASRHNARLQSLTKKSLKAQRPSNPDLLCCDYNQVERDIARGRPPGKKMGGRYVCTLCAGADYWPPMGVDDVVLDFGDGEVEGLGGVGPFEMIVGGESERRADTMAWLSGLPDVFEESAKGVYDER